MAKAEVMRVLAPGGVAQVKAGSRRTRTVKPWPVKMNEWTHYLLAYDAIDLSGQAERATCCWRCRER